MAILLLFYSKHSFLHHTKRKTWWKSSTINFLFYSISFERKEGKNISKYVNKNIGMAIFNQQSNQKFIRPKKFNHFHMKMNSYSNQVSKDENVFSLMSFCFYIVISIFKLPALFSYLEKWQSSSYFYQEEENHFDLESLSLSKNVSKAKGTFLSLFLSKKMNTIQDRNRKYVNRLSNWSQIKSWNVKFDTHTRSQTIWFNFTGNYLKFFSSENLYWSLSNLRVFSNICFVYW